MTRQFFLLKIYISYYLKRAGVNLDLPKTGAGMTEDYNHIIIIVY